MVSHCRRHHFCHCRRPPLMRSVQQVYNGQSSVVKMCVVFRLPPTCDLFATCMTQAEGHGKAHASWQPCIADSGWRQWCGAANTFKMGHC